MRLLPPAGLLSALIAAAAAPALAQPPVLLTIPPNAFAAAQAQDLMARQLALDEIARQQAIATGNELMALEAQARTERNLQGAPGLRLPATIAPPDVSGGGPYPQIDTSRLAAIPDSVLADSNRKVLEAAGERD